MRRDFHADVSENRPLDGNPQCCKDSWLSFPGHKQALRAPADHGRFDFVAIGIEPIREILRQLELGRLLVLGFVFPHHNKRWLSGTLRPMQVFIELESTEILDAERHMQEYVNRQSVLQIDEPPLRHQQIASCGAPQSVR